MVRVKTKTGYITQGELSPSAYNKQGASLDLDIKDFTKALESFVYELDVDRLTILKAIPISNVDYVFTDTNV